MKATWLVCAALVAAAGCGRQMLLQPPDDGVAGATSAAAGASGGATGSGSGAATGAAGGTTAAAGASGGTTGAAGASTGAAGTIAAGPPETAAVDLTQAPSQFTATCDIGVVSLVLTFDNPCRVGHSLSSAGTEAGSHEVDCTLAIPGHPVAWAFVLSIPPTENPVTSFPTVPQSSYVPVGGTAGKVLKTEGTLTFSRVDPSNRAFIASFVGAIAWADPAGTPFVCAITAPLWGAPGDFN